MESEENLLHVSGGTLHEELEQAEDDQPRPK